MQDLQGRLIVDEGFPVVNQKPNLILCQDTSSKTSVIDETVFLTLWQGLGILVIRFKQ